MPVIQVPYKGWRLWVTASNITPLSLHTSCWLFLKLFFLEHQKRDCTSRKFLGNSLLLCASFCPTHCICIPYKDACSVKWFNLPGHFTINSVYMLHGVWVAAISCIGIARPVIKMPGIIMWSFFIFFENSHCKNIKDISLYIFHISILPLPVVLVNGSQPNANTTELPDWYCTWFSACLFVSLTEWWNFGVQVKALAQRMSMAAGKRLCRWREDGRIWSLFPWPMVLRCLGNLPTPLMVWLAN